MLDRSMAFCRICARGIRLRSMTLAFLLLASQAEAGLGDLVAKIGGKSDQGKIVVVFADLSASIKDEDWREYSNTYSSVVNSFSAGDIVVLSPISDMQLTDFRPFRRTEQKKTGVRLNDKEKEEKFRSQLKGDWDALRRSAKPSRSTNILDMFNIAQQIFEHDGATRKERWIVVLSDMVEESKEANFKKNPPAQADVLNIVQQRKSRNLLPSLPGVKVFVAGAGGTNGDTYMLIKNFWFQYLKQTGAEISEKNYGRVAITNFMDQAAMPRGH